MEDRWGMRFGRVGQERVRVGDGVGRRGLAGEGWEVMSEWSRWECAGGLQEVRLGGVGWR